MEKAIGGRFACTRKTAEGDEDEKDSEMTLIGYPK
jgi:hypothetical protein